MKRAETLALLKELTNGNLLQPSQILIEQRSADSFQLRIKGDYNFLEIGILLKNRFSIE